MTRGLAMRMTQPTTPSVPGTEARSPRVPKEGLPTTPYVIGVGVSGKAQRLSPDHHSVRERGRLSLDARQRSKDVRL